MKWFKHLCDADMDEFMIDMMEEYGYAGKGRWWSIVAAVGGQMKRGSDKHEIQMSLREWCHFMRMKPKKLLPFFNFMTTNKHSNVGIEYLIRGASFSFQNDFEMLLKSFQSKNVLIMKLPKLLYLRDNRNSNTPMPCTLEVEVEVEKERLKKKPPTTKKKTKAKPKSKVVPIPQEFVDMYENTNDVPEKWVAWARKKGVVVEIRPIFEDFCRNHLKRGSEWKDWYRTWHTWIDQAKEMNPEYFVKKASNNVRRDRLYNEFVNSYLDSPGEEQGYQVLIGQLKLHCPDHKPYSIEAIRKRVNG
jgi:hypothetical protein